MRYRIKMCGLQTPEAVRWAAAAGADALGLVFYPPSKRAISLETARQLMRAVPSYVSVVGLFVDPEAEWVRRCLRHLALDELQFHGRESPEFCAQFARRYTKALPMREYGSTAEVLQAMTRHPEASAFLLDAFGGQKTGGSGEVFPWRHIPAAAPQALIVAGGLTVENVGALLTQCPQVYGVDVSSGIERDGRKCREKMRAFAEAVARRSVLSRCPEKSNDG